MTVNDFLALTIFLIKPPLQTFAWVLHRSWAIMQKFCKNFERFLAVNFFCKKVLS